MQHSLFDISYLPEMHPLLRSILRFAIAAVWLLNGVYAKMMGAVPRHEAIVARFVGATHAHTLTIAIGAAETLMGIWIVSGFLRRLNACIQIMVVATMNTLEFFFARDLLLWGAWNAAWALVFILAVALYGFSETKTTPHAVVS